jgi:hypothetical protein
MPYEEDTCIHTCGAYVYIHSHIHTYIHAHMHAIIHTHIHSHTPAYNHTYIQTFTHTTHSRSRARALSLSLSPHLTNKICWQGESGLFTVGAPATAKNIISVGAHLNARQSVPDVARGEKVFLGLKSSEEQEQAVQALAAWASNFGRKQAISGTLVLASPLEACTSVAESLVMGKVALVQVLFFFCLGAGSSRGKVALVQVPLLICL